MDKTDIFYNDTIRKALLGPKEGSSNMELISRDGMMSCYSFRHDNLQRYERTIHWHIPVLTLDCKLERPRSVRRRRAHRSEEEGPSK